MAIMRKAPTFEAEFYEGLTARYGIRLAVQAENDQVIGLLVSMISDQLNKRAKSNPDSDLARCAFCQAVVPNSNAAAVRDHVNSCPRHPMRALEASHKSALEAIEILNRQITHFVTMLAAREPPASPADPSTPIKVTLSGREPTPGIAGAPAPLTPSGQHGDYWILSDEERARGFVKPVRDSYRHKTCGTQTTMSRKIAETYARDPNFYGRTFCCACGAHLALAEFEWLDGEPMAPALQPSAPLAITTSARPDVDLLEVTPADVIDAPSPGAEPLAVAPAPESGRSPDADKCPGCGSPDHTIASCPDLPF